MGMNKAEESPPTASYVMVIWVHLVRWAVRKALGRDLDVALMPGHGGIGSDGQSNASCGMTGLHAFGPTATGETPCSMDLAPDPRSTASGPVAKPKRGSKPAGAIPSITRCYAAASRGSLWEPSERKRGEAEKRAYTLEAPNPSGFGSAWGAAVVDHCSMDLPCSSNANNAGHGV